MGDTTTKKYKELKKLEKINEIVVSDGEGKKKTTRLFKFTYEETDYYTEDEVKYLYSMFSEKLRTLMQNIFTYENEQLRKQLVYTVVCKALGENRVLACLKKFGQEDHKLVESLISFVVNQLEEYRLDLEKLEMDFKNNTITTESYEKDKKKLSEIIEILEKSLEEPKDEEMTKEFLEQIKENYDYHLKIFQESYKKDLKNKSSFKEMINFYGEALEKNTSQLEKTENKEFK